MAATRSATGALRPDAATDAKTSAEVHGYHDVRTGVLAATLAGRAPGYTSLGFPDPRRIAPTEVVRLYRTYVRGWDSYERAGLSRGLPRYESGTVAS